MYNSEIKLNPITFQNKLLLFLGIQSSIIFSERANKIILIGKYFFSLVIYLFIFEQDNVGWGVGFGVLAGVLALALALFLLGIKRYRKESPRGSPFTRMAQVFVAAARKWRVQDTSGHNNVNYYYGEEDHEEPHRLHDQPKFHTLLHTQQCR